MQQPTAYDAERFLRRNLYSAGAFLVVAVVLSFFLFFMRADFTWVMFMMLGIVGSIVIGITMSYSPKATLLGLIFLKPMIDQLWWFRAFAGLNFQMLVGAIVPIVAFTFLFMTRNAFFLRAPMCIWVRRLCLLTFAMLAFQGMSRGIDFGGNVFTLPFRFFKACGSGFYASAVAEEFRIISGPALFFLTGWLFTEPQDVKRMGKAVLWSGLWVVIGIGVSYWIGKQQFGAFSEKNPLNGMFYHKDDLARVSTMVCLFGLCFFRLTQSKAVKALCTTISIVMFVVVICTWTRMTWIAIYLSVVFWFCWIGKWKITLPIAIVFGMLTWAPVNRAFEKAKFHIETFNILDPYAVSGRGAIWRAQAIGFWNMSLAEKLVGGGYQRSIGMSVEYGELGVARNAHSCIPLMLVENGLLFTLIYNVLLIRLCKDAWSMRKSEDKNLQTLGALLFAGVIYFYFSGITTNSHTYPSLTWYIWGLGGIVYRIKHFPVGADEAQPGGQRFFSRSFAPVSLVRPRS